MWYNKSDLPVSDNLSRVLPIFTVLQRGNERQKYGVIEDSNKKAERSYSLGNMLYMCSSFNNNTEIFVRKEIYAPKLFIVRVRTVLLWMASGDCILNFQTYLQLRWYRLYQVDQWFFHLLY